MTKLIPILLLFFGELSCQDSVQINYDLDQPDRVIRLPKKLKEISGLSYDSDLLYAVQDEKGNLYQIDLKDESIQKFDFAKDGDYEAVEVVDSLIFAMTSKGDLYQIKIHSTDSCSSQKLERFISKDQNLEGLAYDKDSNRLLIASKKREQDEVKEIFALDLASRKINDHPLLSIDISTMSKTLQKDISEFNPSALAIHPQSGHLYMLSHPAQQLLIVDISKKRFLQLLKLNNKTFIQPEGICFGPQGTLYISTEGKGDIPGKIMIFHQSKK